VKATRSARRAGLLLLCLLGTSCSRKGPGTREAAPTHPGSPLFLIVIDTLRSDHLPFYGYAGVETPALSALRKDSILFEKAYSHVPLTLPSHATLLTGTLPAVNGVLDNGGYRLDPSVPTLAEILKQQGYATGAAVSSIVLAGTSGISRGFDFYDDAIEPTSPGESSHDVRRAGDRTTALLIRWLDGVKQTRVFGFLHLYEPHAPYEPPEPFLSRYPNPYDGAVAAADAIVGTFLEHLKASGLYDRSMIVFLSDHGEGLGDHGESEHGIFLYRESIQVPLLIKLPKGDGEVKPALAGTSVPVPVQLTDVVTTVGKTLAVPGFRPPPGTLSVVDLALGARPPERRIFAETFFPRIRFGWSALRSLVDGHWQYIEAPRPEFYDVEKDPGERTNLAEGKPDPLRPMKIELEKIVSAFKAPQSVDPEQARKLASLGYLSMTSSPAGGPAPDPKDEIATLQLLKEGLGLAAAGRFRESTETFEKLLARNPRIVDAWESYAQGLVRTGRPEKALEAIRKMVELSPPDRTNYLLSAANVCMQIGRFDEALENADLAVSRGDTGGHEVKARAYLAKNDLVRAEAEARQSIESRSTRKRSYLVLADIEARRGNLGKALEITEQVKTLVGERGLADLAGFHFLRGNVLARMNRLPQAEAEFAEEVRNFPWYVDAWPALAMARASQNRVPEAKKTIDEMVRTNGSSQAYALAVRTLTILGDTAGASRYRSEGARKYPGFGR
jgi:arylsulfatase A-like enzyme/Tfp pilus assembly protein PilF